MTTTPNYSALLQSFWTPPTASIAENPDSFSESPEERLRQRPSEPTDSKILQSFSSQKSNGISGSKKNDTVLLEDGIGGGIKIPSKISESFTMIAGLAVVVAAFGGCVAAMNSPQTSTQVDQSSSDTYECAATTGVGERVSRGDIVNLGECLRDKGYPIDPYR